MTPKGNHAFVRTRTTIKRMIKDEQIIEAQKRSGKYTPFAYPIGNGENERHAAEMQKLHRR